MNACTEHSSGYVLSFRSLYQLGRALVFPCDAQGHVNPACLGPAARENLLLARARVGIEYESPEVLPMPH